MAGFLCIVPLCFYIRRRKISLFSAKSVKWWMFLKKEIARVSIKSDKQFNNYHVLLVQVISRLVTYKLINKNKQASD